MAVSSAPNAKPQMIIDARDRKVTYVISVEDASRPDVYMYDCRNQIRILDCRCLITVLHKKFQCYHPERPHFGKYGKFYTFVAD